MKKWVICYSSVGHDELTQYTATVVADIDPDGTRFSKVILL